MKYALIDDDLEFHKIFSKLTINYISSSEINYFTSSTDFLNVISKQKIPYNILFLDIDMPELDGIALSKRLYENNITDALIVFITNKANLVYKAFGLNVIAFIYKPDFENQVNPLFKNIIQFLNSQSYIVLPSINGLAKLQKTNITYCEIVNRKIIIHYYDAQIFHTTLQTLDDLYTLLDNKNFIFVNRSTIVNIAYAKILHKKLILMHDNSTFEISRHRQKIVYKAFIDYNS